MLIPSYTEPVEKYKDYRNRKLQQHLDKVNKQMWQIKECSLKPEDKKNLKKKILEAVEIFNL